MMDGWISFFSGGFVMEYVLCGDMLFGGCGPHVCF